MNHFNRQADLRRCSKKIYLTDSGKVAKILTNNNLIKKALSYIDAISCKVLLKGHDKLMKMLTSNADIEQQQDLMISLFLAYIFSDTCDRIILEEEWEDQKGKIRSHDLVAYFYNGTKIVNEIKRLKQTNWDLKEQNRINITNGKASTLFELKEDSSRNRGFLETILKDIIDKKEQFEPNVTNIMWIASKGLHYRASDIEDAASHFAKEGTELSTDLLRDKPYKDLIRPKYLNALGWIWDGDPIYSTLQPECFFISLCDDLESLKNIINNNIICKSF